LAVQPERVNIPEADHSCPATQSDHCNQTQLSGGGSCLSKGKPKIGVVNTCIFLEANKFN